MVGEINLEDLKLDTILKCKTETPFSLKDFRLFLSNYNQDPDGIKYLEFYEWMKWYNVFYYNNIAAYNNGTYRQTSKKDNVSSYEFPITGDYDYSARNSEVYEPADILADYIENGNNETFVSDSTGSRTVRINHLPFSNMVLEMLHAFFNPESPLFFPVPTQIFQKVHLKLGNSAEPMVFQPLAKYVFDKLEQDFYPAFIKSVVSKSVLGDRIIWILVSILFLFLLAIMYWQLAMAKLDYPVYISCLPLWLIAWFSLLNTIFGIPPSNYYQYIEERISRRRRLPIKGPSTKEVTREFNLRHRNTSRMSIGSTKFVNYKTKHKVWLFILFNSFLAIYFTAMGLFIPLKLYNLY